jgi:REP element-mobilizing transposase RayT
MLPTPLYRASDLRPAYQLRYSWTGWPSLHSLPADRLARLLPGIAPDWERDGIRLLESALAPDTMQLTVSTTPQVSPVMLAARLKGRLQYHARQVGTPIDFSRKLAVRSLGDARRESVEAYIRAQVTNEHFCDDRYHALLARFTTVNPRVELSQPAASRSGRYWYNLHLVLVVETRYRVGEEKTLATIHDVSLRICAKKGYEASTLAVMPDHLHLALRGNIEHSPQEIALAFLNNLAHALGQRALWQRGYYAGTFGEYDMGAVRRGQGECGRGEEELGR